MFWGETSSWHIHAGHNVVTFDGIGSWKATHRASATQCKDRHYSKITLRRGLYLTDVFMLATDFLLTKVNSV